MLNAPILTKLSLRSKHSGRYLINTYKLGFNISLSNKLSNLCKEKRASLEHKVDESSNP
jgi:hypothetical protein